jgi:hypothetical protein
MFKSSGKNIFSRIASRFSSSSKRKNNTMPTISPPSNPASEPPIPAPHIPTPSVQAPPIPPTSSSSLRTPPVYKKPNTKRDMIRSWEAVYGTNSDDIATPKLKFDEESIRQKNCIPGPNVIFPKNAVPFSTFISNYNKEGSLGCGPGKYPQYTDGKYCCTDRMFTKQELLDYINFLLEGAITNVSDTAFLKYQTEIDYILKLRFKLLVKNPQLIDNLEVPEGESGNINDFLMKWYQDMINESTRLSRTQRPNPLGGKTRRRKYYKTKKSKRKSKRKTK